MIQRKRLTDCPTHEDCALEQIPIMCYELGNVAKMLVYEKRYDNRLYKVEAKIEMSDLIAQIAVMCEREGWDFWGLKRLGEERFREKTERHEKLGE